MARYYSNGTSALKRDRHFEVNHKLNEKKNREKKRNKQINEHIFKVKIRSLFLTITTLVVLTLLLMGYADITALRSEITSLERDIYNLEMLEVEYQGEIVSHSRFDDIYYTARETLGMDFAKHGEVVYINLNKYEDTEEKNKENIFEKIVDFASIRTLGN